MERESFDESLRGFIRQRPFYPFIIELVSGSQLSVDHPEALVFRTRTAIHFDQNDIPTLFDHQGVARLIGTVDVANSS